MQIADKSYKLLSTSSASECLQPPVFRVTHVGPAIHRLRRPSPLSPRPSAAGCHANIAFRSFPDTSCRRFPAPSPCRSQYFCNGRLTGLWNTYFVYIHVYFFICMCQLLCSLVLDVTPSVCVYSQLTDCIPAVIPRQ